MTDRITGIALAPGIGLWWRGAFTVAVGLLLLLVVAMLWLYLSRHRHLGGRLARRLALAIINYVWWIGIASGGTFIFALLFLLHAE